MKILVIGKGGREHALAYACKRSALCDELICAPGNPGMAKIGECVNVKDNDVEGLVALAKERNVDLTIVGPEATLALGVVDAFKKEGQIRRRLKSNQVRILPRKSWQNIISQQLLIKHSMI